MISMEAKPSEDVLSHIQNDVNSDNFRLVYADWQAIRIIRDNYFDGWRMFYTFFFWFGATMVGVAGFVVINLPFHKNDAYLAGLIGFIMIFGLLVFAVLLFFRSKQHVRDVNLILERAGALFFADKVLNIRGAVMMVIGAAFGISAGLAAWVYVFFFYYVNLI